MFVKLKKLFRPSFREEIEKYTEAITFAEANITKKKDVKRIIERREGGWIVMVSEVYNFSKQLMEYAISFAARMEYDIIALNVGPIPKHIDSLNDICDPICETFSSKCFENIDEFKKCCKESGISFEHIIKFGNTNKCLHELRKQYKIDWVMSEPETEIPGKTVVPVFCLSH